MKYQPADSIHAGKFVVRLPAVSKCALANEGVDCRPVHLAFHSASLILIQPSSILAFALPCWQKDSPGVCAPCRAEKRIHSYCPAPTSPACPRHSSAYDEYTSFSSRALIARSFRLNLFQKISGYTCPFSSHPSLLYILYTLPIVSISVVSLVYFYGIEPW